MSPKFEPQNKKLVSAWQEVNPDDKEYVEMDIIEHWTAIALKSTNSMEHLGPEFRISDMIHAYLVQECEIGEVATNVQFKYQEAVDFLNWVTDDSETDQENPKGQRQRDITEQNEQEHQQAQVIEPPVEQKKREEFQKRSQSGEQVERKNDRAQQQQNENQQNVPSNRPQSSIDGQNIRNDESGNLNKNNFKLRKHSDDFNLSRKFEGQAHVDDSNRPVSQTKGRIHPIKKTESKEVEMVREVAIRPYHHWREYIRIIFDHFCKLTYAMGQDPTFDLIQHKSQTMTINKFMIFCRDFAIIKLPNVTRIVLVDCFKKNSQCFKEMNLGQFTEAIEKISKIAYPELKEKDSQAQGKDGQEQEKNGQEQGKQQELSKHMKIMLKYLQIDIQSAFKEKMKKVGIQSFQIRSKVHSNQTKKQPFGYKFKVEPKKRIEEDSQRQLIERKYIRSEKKLKPKEKLPAPGVFAKRAEKTPFVGSKNTLSLPKGLHPTIPPPKRVKQPASMEDSRFSGMTGYANIHRLKNSKMNDSQGRSRGNNRLKLNSILEEAKMMVEKQEDARANAHYRENGEFYKRDQRQSSKLVRMRDSEGNYRLVYEQEQEEANTPIIEYEQEGRNNRPPMQRQKYPMQPRLQLKPKNEDEDALLGLIEDQSNDEDEYLKEHLSREKKSDHISKRLNKRIQDLDYGREYN